MAEHVEAEWAKVKARVGPIAPEAFAFMREGLTHTVRTIHGHGAANDPSPDDTLHVSGQQLCLGLRDFAIQRYGLLARTVLSRWGINTTEDFGRIVYAMIEAGLLRKSDRDSIDDFRGVFDFSEAFASATDEG